jgi:NAD(P)H dehydrogenase (quinone)
MKEFAKMTKVLVLYYSSYGHTERMAQAVAEGVRETGAEANIKRVPELVPEDVAKKSGYKLDQAAPIAAGAELPNYDAIIFGSGTRFGVVTSQMRNFLDQTGGLWAKGALVGKVGSVFTGSGTQHGGQESTILTMIPTLLHHGMIVVGLPYSFEGQSRHDENHWLFTLWRLHDYATRRQPHALGKRTRCRTLSGPACCADRRQAADTNPERALKEDVDGRALLAGFRISLDHTPRWTLRAQRTASNTLPNSASKPSPLICRNQQHRNGFPLESICEEMHLSCD